MMKDIYHDSVIVPLLEAHDLVNTDHQSDYVDLAGFDGAEIVVTVGALTGVDGSNYLTPILQEATTGPATVGNYGAVAAGDIIGGYTKIDSTSEDSVVQRACYVGTARYINVKLDYTSTGISVGIVGAYAILRRAAKGPASSLTPTTGTVS